MADPAALDSRAGLGAGWKIAGTSAAGQRHIGADRPVVGRLYQRCLLESDAEVDARVLRMRSVEPEFAFRIGRDIEPGETEFLASDVLAGGRELPSGHRGARHPLLRFSGRRHPEPGRRRNVRRISGGGPPVADWCLEELRSVEVVVRRNGVQVSAGSGEAVLGDPCGALVWLANELRSRGQMLRAGDIIATGAAAPPIEIDDGDSIEAEFGGRASLTVSFRV